MAVSAAGCSMSSLACGFVVPLAPRQPTVSSWQLDVGAMRGAQCGAGHSAPHLLSSSACAAGAAATLVASRALARRAGSWRSKASRAALKPQAAAAPAAGAEATFDPTTQVGITEPVGFWDPVSLMKDRTGAWKSEETFTQWREAEIKHGRLAMVASLGLVAGTFNKFPGFEDVPSGAAALQTQAGGAGFGIVVLLAAFFEVDFLKQDPSKAPGNFGDPLGVGVGYPESGFSTDMRNKELNHGRLAMSGVGTELLIEYFTKMTPEEQLQQLVPGAAFALFFGLVLVWSNYAEEGSVTSDSTAIVRSETPGMPAPTKTWILFAVLAVFLERTIHSHA